MGELIPLALAWSQFGLLGMLGGLVSYFYPPSTEMRFSWKLFVSKLVISFFVGKVAGEFIAADNQFKSGYIMLLGFFAYPVLGVLEIKVKAWVENFNPPGTR
ncbi:hypothetical protein [Pseudomonas sp. RIT-PI-S]|uniref:hypothetical protein n=1 Tax=Pseudomonas sp. RIT-PI-S TaxID=3035295 RepID=UPI0021D86CEF|nr:hypothetical protein [Pseudomonas sp. RIT-PI-S]